MMTKKFNSHKFNRNISRSYSKKVAKAKRFKIKRKKR